VRLPLGASWGPRERLLCALQHYFGGGAARPLKGGVQAAAGVTRLMHQCTAMLRERMCDELRTPPAAPPVRCARARPTTRDAHLGRRAGRCPLAGPRQACRARERPRIACRRAKGGARSARVWG